MSFQPPRGPMPSMRPSRSTGPVLSVGRRVFVHCPGTPGRTIELTDEAGRAGGSTLTDGAEVEILAWRPRGSGGTRYRVQAKEAGIEGWLGVDNLRPGLTPAPPAAPAAARTVAAPVAASNGGGRKFGQRSGVVR